MEMLYRLSYVGGAAALSCMDRRGPFDPTSTRSRDGAYVMLRLKAENPNQPLSSVEKGCGDCEPMNVRAAKTLVNRKFAGSCQLRKGPNFGPRECLFGGIYPLYGPKRLCGTEEMGEKAGGESDDNRLSYCE